MIRAVLNFIAFVIAFSSFAGIALADNNNFNAFISSLEEQHSARIGVSVYDGQANILANRDNERFPMNSTFKTFACAKVLFDVEAGDYAMEDTLEFDEKDIVSFSPVLEANLALGGLSLNDLCFALVARSDNTAANLILTKIGGPQALTEFMKDQLSDNVTRMDRYEPAANDTSPGDPRDTTTPKAIARSLFSIFESSVLSEHSKAKLKSWMADNTTGLTLVRPHVPAGWLVGDRTGAGPNSRSVTAFLWHASRTPLVIAIYMADTKVDFKTRNAIISQVASKVIDMQDMF